MVKKYLWPWIDDNKYDLHTSTWIKSKHFLDLDALRGKGSLFCFAKWQISILWFCLYDRIKLPSILFICFLWHYQIVIILFCFLYLAIPRMGTILVYLVLYFWSKIEKQREYFHYHILCSFLFIFVYFFIFHNMVSESMVRLCHRTNGLSLTLYRKSSW